MQAFIIRSVSINTPLLSYIWSVKGNRVLLLIATAGMIIQFTIFKLLYPFPDFFSDSYSYLFAAYAHLDVSIWPIGYSKFLYLFHKLTYSATALTAFQYFFLEIGCLYFFFSFLYLFKPKKINRTLLFIFLFFNPLFLYISNYINSDPLFAALSLFWFTQLLWIIYHPRIYQLFIHAILLFLCFTVRNNAYYYPIISLIAFCLSRQDWKLKLAGSLLPFAFILPFIIFTRNAAYKMTGSHQFSLFTGWQLANNALYMRGHIEVDSSELPNEATRVLDRISTKYFAHRAPEFDDYLSAYVANFFIREPNAPLKTYYDKYYQAKNEYESVVYWGRASVTFSEYGSTLIKEHPIEFIQYYLFRNTRNYLIPPLEKLEIYNLGMPEVYPIARYWFHFKSKSVTAISEEGQGILLGAYPFFFLFINLIFFGYGILALINMKNFTYPSFRNHVLLLGGSFWLINAAFSIFATVNVFRYQFFPMILYLAFSFVLIETIETKKIAKNAIPHSYA
jgi:hypothetical protein